MTVLGVGGIFFRAEDPEALTAWYAEHLGVGAGCSAPGTGPADEWSWTVQGGPLVFAPFAQDTDYWSPDRQQMLNLRVEDLEGLLARLAAAGIEAITKDEWDSPETGRFARIHDPAGNPIELWQEPAVQKPAAESAQDTRVDPPAAGGEADVLLGFLDYHRQTFAMKTAGLGADELARTHPPSTMTLGGLTKHLAYVEDWWCHQVLAGHDAPQPWASADWDADEDWEWHSAADDDPADLRGLLEQSLARSRSAVGEALEAGGLDALAARPGRRGELRLRWILVHLIEEYSRHNGHADLIREAVDGQVGE